MGNEKRIFKILNFEIWRQCRLKLLGVTVEEF